MENLFESNQKLVTHIYKKYFSGFNQIKDDLIQEGLFALWNLIPKYEPSKGEFSTFAGKIIHHTMCKYIRKETKQTKFCLREGDEYNGQEVSDILDTLEQKEDISPQVNATFQTTIVQFKTSQQKLVQDWADNPNTYRVSEKNNVSRQYVCKIINQFKTRFQDEYEKTF